jgi:hypothetical protein
MWNSVSTATSVVARMISSAETVKVLALWSSFIDVILK